VEHFEVNDAGFQGSLLPEQEREAPTQIKEGGGIAEGVRKKSPTKRGYESSSIVMRGGGQKINKLAMI